ncbi:MAG: methylenetetrahydrofolate reductase [NAD(P)H] [bacterium]
MKISDIIKNTGRSLSFEFFPPKTEQGEYTLFETIDKLSVFNPSYVSVTYGAGGSTRDKTIAIVERIKKETSLTVMPHLTCIGSTKQEISEIVNYYKNIGIENILALRGDPPMGVTEYPIVEDGFDYASDLIEFLKLLKTFSIGAAVYPEGHKESPNIEMDMIYTKKKVDVGADFLITQMFFENRFFYEFLQRAEKYNINVPIIPGIMIITDFKKIRQLSRMCGTSIPKHLGDLIDKYAGSNDESRSAGIEYTTEQCRDLVENGIKYFHFYTLNHWEAASEIINNLSLA